MDVSVVIPTLNAGENFRGLLEAVFSQEFDGELEIIIVDSGSEDGTREVVQNFPAAKLIKITGFTHGKSRNIGAGAARGNFLVFMTQDSLPQNKHWLKNLLMPFEDKKVAATFSRQVPRFDSNPMEQHFLSKNFPGRRIVRQLNSSIKPTLPEVFFSNVSSAIRQELWERYPFDEKIIMSEDQEFACDVLMAGYRTVYEPDSIVIHSRNYSLKQVFQRHFDVLYSLEEIFEHPLADIFKWGINYTAGELKYVWRHHRAWLPYCLLYNLSRIGGGICGRYARRFPRKLRRMMSHQKYYWNQN